jgi:hypothetical protein
MIGQLHEILGQKFNPCDDTVYWTHSLHCIPRSRGAIWEDWPEGSVRCIDNLKSELKAIPEDELAIVALGAYATGMMWAIIQDQKEPKPMRGLNDFIFGLGSDAAKKQDLSTPRFKQPYIWEGKKLYLTAFLLKTYEERWLREDAKRVQLEETEFIQKWIKYVN